jgi:hypothetical protein
MMTGGIFFVYFDLLLAHEWGASAMGGGDVRGWGGGEG